VPWILTLQGISCQSEQSNLALLRISSLIFSNIFGPAALRKHIKYSGPGHRGLKNVKAHKCSFCDQTFSTSDDLVLHTSSFHVCLYCAATFAQNNGLKDHIESAHKVKYEFSDSCVQKIIPNVVTFVTRNYGKENK
jgi:hypothetical protein